MRAEKRSHRPMGAWLLAILLAAASPPVRSAAPLRVVGSDLLGSGFADALRDFARRNEVPLTLSLEGSWSGLAQLQSGGADLGLNYERVVAKPAGEPDSQTVRFTLRQLW